MRRLAALIGEWSMAAEFPRAAPTDVLGRTVFEWMQGERLVVQRWEVPDPAAPDGVAIIGPAAGGDGYLQHYFDSRGVARVYEMSFSGGEWKLWRDSPDFSPLDFCQRFSASFSEDGGRIAGSWERSGDGSSWQLDFNLAYTKVE